MAEFPMPEAVRGPTTRHKLLGQEKTFLALRLGATQGELIRTLAHKAQRDIRGMSRLI